MKQSRHCEASSRTDVKKKICASHGILRFTTAFTKAHCRTLHWSAVCHAIINTELAPSVKSPRDWSIYQEGAIAHEKLTVFAVTIGWLSWRGKEAGGTFAVDKWSTLGAATRLPSAWVCVLLLSTHSKTRGKHRQTSQRPSCHFLIRSSFISHSTVSNFMLKCHWINNIFRCSQGSIITQISRNHFFRHMTSRRCVTASRSFESTSSGRMNHRETNSSWTFRPLKDENTRLIRNVG